MAKTGPAHPKKKREEWSVRPSISLSRLGLAGPILAQPDG